MIKRSLQEIQGEIQLHEEAINVLKQEVKNFQSACPHPDNFQKIDRMSYDDEYGTIEGYGITTTCLLCGHKDYKQESVKRSRFR